MKSNIQKQRSRLNAETRNHMIAQSTQATRIYNQVYPDANLYFKMATQDKTNRYANALIDDALAICGDPFYQVSKRRWGADARAFLRFFKIKVIFYPGPVEKAENGGTRCHVYKNLGKGQVDGCEIVRTYDFLLIPKYHRDNYEYAREDACERREEHARPAITLK